MIAVSRISPVSHEQNILPLKEYITRMSETPRKECSAWIEDINDNYPYIEKTRPLYQITIMFLCHIERPDNVSYRISMRSHL